MRKALPLLLLAFLLGAVSSPNRKLQFERYRNDRFEIRYVPTQYLTGHLKSFASELTRRFKEAERRLGTQIQFPIIYLFNDFEEKGMEVKEISIAHADPDKNILYCVVNEDFNGVGEGLEYQLALRTKYGAGKSENWERDVAASFAGIWNQKKMEDWIDFLLARNLRPEFPAYWKDPEQFSGYLVHPWNAIFAKFIREKYGLEALISLYRTGEAAKGFESAWSRYVGSLKYQPLSERTSFRPEFQKGVCFACWNSYDASYATKKSEESLNELKKYHVNWVAGIPYGFMRFPNASLIRFAGNHIASESDESMVVLAKEVKRRGMKLMLKPQIWIGHDSWTGNVDFQTQAEWNQWFNSYQRWIIHYAILAEQIQADVFCIGTELVQTTLKQPEAWRSLIKKVRNVYRGPLVYAANHGKEFEEISFWQDLDYIGLDNYYSVRTNLGEGNAEMKKAFQAQKEKIRSLAERYHRPVLFTEIGYMANVGAGMGSREYEFSEYDAQLQAECYRLAFETYWNEPWFYGMYFWKWFSDPSDRGRNADPHSPHGRPAGTIMAQWYQKAR